MPKLIVVGAGIKSLAHITQETLSILKKADKVLYLVNENILKSWITKEAKQSESLEPLYFSSEDRIQSYQAITDYIIHEYDNYNCLCVIFYGHPCVFADSALNAAKVITKTGGAATILPAVSSLDCMFADLQIDPGNGGLFCIEATELLMHERKLDPLSNVVIFQAANLGRRDLKNTSDTQSLVEYLQKFYPADQTVCVYEAAVLPGQSARIDWLILGELSDVEIIAQSSLYIPPKKILTNGI